MKPITKFISDDGCEFSTEAECLNYEAETAEIAKIMQHWPQKPQGCDFTNGSGYIRHDRETFLRAQADLAKLVRKRFKDVDSLRHIDWAVNADRPAGMSFIGRLVDDACDLSMRRAWQRIACVDEQFREWGQPYYAINPDKGKQVDLST